MDWQLIIYLNGDSDVKFRNSEVSVALVISKPTKWQPFRGS